MTFAVHLSKDDPTPPYDQLLRQIAAAIGSGLIAAGTQLPTVRQLAGDLGVATGTVMRTYEELEIDGLVRKGRGAGTTVAAIPVLSPTDQRDRLDRLTQTFIVDAKLLGATDDQLVDVLNRFLSVG